LLAQLRKTFKDCSYKFQGKADQNYTEQAKLLEAGVRVLWDFQEKGKQWVSQECAQEDIEKWLDEMKEMCKHRNDQIDSRVADLLHNVAGTDETQKSHSYDIKIYHIGIEQLFKQINLEWKDQGSVFKHFWSGYQTNMSNIILHRLKSDEKTIEDLSNNLKESASKIEDIHIRNKELEVRIDDLQKQLWSENNVVKATTELYQEELVNKNESKEDYLYLKQKILTVLPSINWILNNPEVMRKLEFEGIRSSSQMPYYNNEQFLNTEEKAVIKDLVKIMDSMHVEFKFYSKKVS